MVVPPISPPSPLTMLTTSVRALRLPGHALRARAAPVDFDVTSRELRAGLAGGLAAALVRGPVGAGLAAPMLGVGLRVIIDAAEGPATAMFNPRIEETSGRMVAGEEGNLCLPRGPGRGAPGADGDRELADARRPGADRDVPRLARARAPARDRDPRRAALPRPRGRATARRHARARRAGRARGRAAVRGTGAGAPPRRARLRRHLRPAALAARPDRGPATVRAGHRARPQVPPRPRPRPVPRAIRARWRRPRRARR